MYVKQDGIVWRNCVTKNYECMMHNFTNLKSLYFFGYLGLCRLTISPRISLRAGTAVAVIFGELNLSNVSLIVHVVRISLN